MGSVKTLIKHLPWAEGYMQLTDELKEQVFPETGTIG